jgi:Lipopolysaccharide-assembly
MLRKKNTYLLIVVSILSVFNFSSCYSFKDVTIAPEVKTAKVNYFGNKASYVNPQLSPALTEKLRQKINGQTRLTLVQADDAHYDISGWVSQYILTTSGISNQQAATNRLMVTVHLIFKNRLDDKASFETDLSRNFDFDARLTLQQAESQKGEEIIRNMTDEIFNRIFSNW